MLVQRALLLSCLLTVGAGCSTRIGDFTALSSKNVYCKNVDVTKLPQQRAEGKDICFLGIGADFKDAVDRALEKGHGNMMIDAVFYVENYPFFAGYKVVGTVVNVPYQP
jgi:hypothetical protein